MSEKICPIMSRPSQGNSVKLYSSEPLFESEDEMKKYGWTPIDGKPFGDVVLCQKEKCMAWITDCIKIKRRSCTFSDEQLEVNCVDQSGNKRICKAHCKLIERGNP